jgi:hypothetical protein
MKLARRWYHLQHRCQHINNVDQKQQGSHHCHIRLKWGQGIPYKRGDVCDVINTVKPHPYNMNEKNSSAYQTFQSS